jgi:hypothetical protein
MSAEVIKLPERKMHPADFCKPLVAECGGDDATLSPADWGGVYQILILMPGRPMPMPGP